MVTSIFFNNLDSYKDLRLTISDMAYIPVANEEIEESNGYIIKTGKYPNIELPVTFRTKRLDGLLHYQDKIVNWLNNVKDNRLRFSFSPKKYYIVKNVIINNISRDFHAYGTISVTFILEPFKYKLYEHPITLTNPQKINYDGTVNGEPNFKIYGNGNIQLSINSETVQINNVDGYVELDTKYMLCLNQNKTSKSRDMVGGFPVLSIGINVISWSGNVNRIEMLKRTSYL